MRTKKQGMEREKRFVNDAGGREGPTYSSERVEVWRSRPTEAH